MKRFISILLVVSMIFVMLSAQGFVSYGSTTNAIAETGTYNIGLVKVPKATAVDISYIGYEEYGSEIKFSAKYTPVDCEPDSVVSWTSSNPEVVEIDNSGNAFCKGVGTAVITVTTRSGLSAEKEIVVKDCDEIKVNEEKSYMVLFDNKYRYKFVPEVSGVYSFSFDRDRWVYLLLASLNDAKLEEIVYKGNDKDLFECTLTAGNAYYLEIDTDSGDVMCGASVMVELKEEIVEVTASPTDVPVETATPVPTETEMPEPTDTPNPEPTITICPTETPTPEPTENVEINESDFEYVVSDKGEVTITKYTGSDINLVVPDELGGNPVKVIGNNAFANCENLENILIPESITSIKQNAFSKICIRGIFYRGSKEEWEKIIVEDGNYYIKAALYFYNFDGQFPDGDNPVIGISAMSDYVNKDNQYAIRVGAYNLSSLENAEVILRYNPEVLKLNIGDSLMIGMESLYDGGYRLLSEGNIRIGVSRDETWIYYDNDSIMGFTLYFDVIGSGNTDFSVELTEVNYRGDSQLQVITSNFAKSVESEVAPPDPTETIKPTEEIVETVCPWAPTGDVNIDDKINAEDALLVLKHAAKIVMLSGQSLEVADTNDDDSIDAKDALEILKYAAKIE